MIKSDTLILALKSLLQKDLPGFTAQSDLMPEGRIRLPETSDLQQASVLIAFFPRNGDWYFPLIRRVVDGYAHSGQVGLPGGRAENDESAQDTALREAHEEVGIEPGNVTLCGRLSDLPIPVSAYLVRPFLGVLPEEPHWVLQEQEVDELLLIRVGDFLKKESIQAEQRTFRGQLWTIPYFDLENHKVWGATAMILSELRALLMSLDPELLDQF